MTWFNDLDFEDNGIHIEIRMKFKEDIKGLETIPLKYKLDKLKNGELLQL